MQTEAPITIVLLAPPHAADDLRDEAAPEFRCGVRYRTRSPVTWRKLSPSFAFGSPGTKRIVWVPRFGQLQAKRTASGKLRPALDLFCQMPVASKVSRPSTKTRAWPFSQQRLPSVPSTATADPVIDTDAGSFTVGRDRVRWILTPARGGTLNSSKFDLRVERSGGEVAAVTADGGGWGHGIGMCQVGAMGRARAGQDYRTILETYYPGARLTRMY